MQSPKKHRGIALITALLVMALAAIAAAAVLVSAQTALRRTATLIDGEKAWWYATGLESFARKAIDSAPRKSTTYDGLDEYWAKPLVFPADQGVLRGQVSDLQGRFNLNNLGAATLPPTPGPNPQALAQFLGLFNNNPKLLHYAGQAPAIADAIKDWIDADQQPTGGGAEDDYYSSLKPPYLAANRQMKSPTELLAVRGMTPEIYQLLLPFVAALPLGANNAPTKVNVNTAPDELLMSLSAGMTSQQVGQIVNARPIDTAGFAMLKANGSLPPNTADLVDIRTSYFLLFGEASIGTARVALYSVLMRPTPNGKLVVTSRSLDTE